MTQEKLNYLQMIKAMEVEVEQELLEVMLPDDLPQMNRYGANRITKRRRGSQDMTYSMAPRS
ncbi:hypothetical protein [Celerinatantimonas diazotrophica]|uniref:Transposase n=1 Tax=Celerinatantimonas diazotrophica TaxID=412034 RepID=A0A4R1K922_9GAMM|nr:hypothetical protein [Celerinatantimonas diazotrophica]TCK60343.1 hypothetical protein EV690_0572 [Celerinatantimonas diazotrophica]CAG9295099.1 hypothetical protein CEDIAZO_00211 [Celerinatantimonas diazotrophica]